MARTRQQQARIVAKAARRYGISPKTLWGVFGTESNFGHNLGPSSAGAVGPFQFMPGTAQGLGINPHKFRQAAFGAAKYLSQYKGRGTAGMLAAYNAGPAGNPNNPQTRAYIPSVRRLGETFPDGAARGVKGGRGGGRRGGRRVVGNRFVGGVTGGLQRPPKGLVSTSVGAVNPQTLPQGSEGVLGLIQSLQSQPQARSSAGVAMPSFTPQVAMPGGFAPAVPAGGGGTSAPTDISPLLDAIRTPGGTIVRPSSPGASNQQLIGGGRTPRVGQGAKAVRYPLTKVGKVIGTPHKGTHTLGNWQSDNAVDLAVPVGTPMTALERGVVVKVRHHPQNGSRFAGDQITIRGASGQEYFFAHGVSHVKPGQHLQRGQVIGRTGSANGVAHLHLGIMNGNPLGIVHRAQRREAQAQQPVGRVQGGGGRGVPRGRVHVSPGADRSGAHTHPVVQRFVSHVAGIFGRPLTIGTGTNHSKFTVSGNVSDHWTGNAADVPLTGAALVHAGRAALIAAGMSPRAARQKHGGLFNVGHWQIIFNTNAPGVGDHTTHLHVGFSPRR